MIKFHSAIGILWGCFLHNLLYSQNPICPPNVFIADPAAHVWPDGKVYIYGSLDMYQNQFCSEYYHMLSSSDMKRWTLHKNIFSSIPPNDEVPYNNNILYAPDAYFKNGKYYLYYCQPDRDAEGVAESDTPIGPFKNGAKINLYGHNEIDPGVFIDEDGTAYYVWGQFGLKMAKLNKDMKSIDPASIKTNVITEKGHFFHEGAHMVKRNGLYYIVYAHMGRKNKPTCIGYAYSKKPMGSYKYGGVIIDNEGCDPANWNNHGSIVAFKNQWYVLYHRTTNGVQSLRKACIEPIAFNSDGTINEVEMTSQGANQPLLATDTIQAEWACLYNGNARFTTRNDKLETVSEIKPNDYLAYKYINFNQEADSIIVRVKLSTKEGGFNLHSQQPWGRWHGYVHFPESAANEWAIIKAKIQPIKGVTSIWLKFYGKANAEPFYEIDYFYFK